jgi:LCP family protein required for cell wall assembly
MNDFQNRQTGRRRPNVSIDGVSAPRPVTRPYPGSSEQSKPVGDFKRRDGFHPTSGREASALPAQQSQPSFHKKPSKTKKLKLPFRKKSRDENTPLDGLGRRAKLSRKKKILRTVGVIFAILLLILGFLFAKGYINLRKVLSGSGGAAALQDNVDPSRLRGEGDGRVNVLVLGRGGEGHEGADLTDTIILVSIDPIAKEAALLSIPRDLYVAVPGSGSMKINSVFYTGKAQALNQSNAVNADTIKRAEESGANLLDKTVEQTLGVPVHYHAIIDFQGFKQAVDTVGGIDFNVPSSVREQMRIDGRNYLLDVSPGQQHMDGFEALAYSRSRHTSARGDFDRSERQRLIVLALKEKTLSLGTFSNPAKISSLLDTFGDHVHTNFSLQDLSRLYDISKDIGSSKISSIGLADPPNNYVTTGTIGDQSVVIPRAGVGDYREIQSYIRNTLKDGFIKNENASVTVLNGTSVPGVATAKAEELRSFGYNVVKVDNAPTKNYDKSVLVDFRGGSKRYTKSYLERRFSVSAVDTLPDPTIQPENADFVIIIGSDQATR